MHKMGLLLALFAAVFVAGCGTFTGIPSHGGGKRFSIEQELISASARAVAKDINVAPLVGRKCALYVITIGDEGSGNLVGGRYSWEAALRGDYVNIPSVRSNTTITTTGQNGETTNARTKSNFIDGVPLVSGGIERVGGGVAYQGPPAYQAEAFINPRDAMFLQGIIHEAFALRGVIIVPPESADVDVYISVDVFGTNRSRTEMHVYNRESLVAKTAVEVTAFDRERRVVLPPVSSSFEAEYREEYIFWMGPFSTSKCVRQSDALLVDFRSLAPPSGRRAVGKVEAPPPPAPGSPPVEKTRPNDLTAPLAAPVPARPEDVQRQEEAPLGPPRPAK